jgi:hypothetical protein
MSSESFLQPNHEYIRTVTCVVYLKYWVILFVPNFLKYERIRAIIKGICAILCSGFKHVIIMDSNLCHWHKRYLGSISPLQ